METINAPIQGWLDLDHIVHYQNASSSALVSLITDKQLAQPCMADGAVANCTDVCTDPRWLFNETYPQNLVTCGTWSELQSYWYNVSERHDDVFAPYTNLSLTEGNSHLAEATLGQISQCIQLTPWYQQRAQTRDLKEGTACNFHAPVWWQAYPDYSPGTLDSVSSCMEFLCRPPRYDPEIGGIGVSGRRCLRRRTQNGSC